MKAAVLRSIPGELTIEDVQIDNPGPREVLVRTVAAGVCHSDLHYLTGAYDTLIPTVMGHESAGVVEAVGEAVSYVSPGDHVISSLSVFCGHCEYCLSGRMALCPHEDTMRPAGAPPRLSQDGETVHQYADVSSFAEQLLVHEHALVKVNPEMPLDRAALVGCAVTTGLGAVFRTAAVAPGETVAVIGCGGVGLSAIQGARIAGAGRIIAIDVVASKLELAKFMGATDAIDASDVDPVEIVLELTSGGVHHAFDAIGRATTPSQAFGMLRAGGTATIIGMIALGETVELPGVDFLAEKRIQGSCMGSNQFRIDAPRFVDFYFDGRLDLDSLITERIELDRVGEAMEALKKGEAARSVIMFD
ncbi:MAG: Zn-dependent alcohol dehydrogenase [Acidimicrobiales bacterium]|jgi:S-(hydroxymethyl)glutathione dehydrogenase/alcohol dehydrogenase|nr:Zn-dependent alcohol dehydrogenase [bacterium]MDG2028687.1 Zn-dependent alcohol dehydrogenase [Acidimicrobiales bacterium]